MKKVLFLINTLEGGGAEKILVETANSLDKNKYQITVQTVINKGIHKASLSPQVRYKTIIPFKNNFLQKVFSKILFKMLGCSFVYNFFVKDKYDYEIAFLEGLPTKILSNSTNKIGKKYAWLHTDIESYPNSFKVFSSELKEKEAYKKFDKIFCVSESVRQSIQHKYGIETSNLEVVYNIIDDTAILMASREIVDISSFKKPLFISVGRLKKVKGYDRLLRVHNQLIKEGFLHTLLILGDGEEYPFLEKYIRENNLQATAFLLGFQINPYKYISKADLFICSSLAEGYSTVVSEAVLCGVPVLSTNVAGANEPYDSPRCSLVIDNNEVALYNSLKKLLLCPQKLTELKNDVLSKKNAFEKNKMIQKFEEEVFIN